ncbi:uncharacterized protein SPSK_08015 [Sporothrix schenckii 1099-18]|uniref:Uncharacterized protein n=1 Tax=Sporothrix schenckii 1099-18 TaxID=1397361 RepID=A0A0F2MHS3_SPOSC|nr:uncharacterized protein SPSK_08015 [Sporothrix schenckii 1099-18]KJR88410.1 hypothetical protein SPSK_08015 [Sporothrix schenckii 1099-18]
MSANRPTGKGGPRPPAQDVNFEEWNEAQLEAALQKLKEAHLKPRALDLLTHFLIPATAEILHAKSHASLLGAAQEVKGFKEYITNEEFRKVVDHATLSRRRNGKNIKPWKAREEPDWATL